MVKDVIPETERRKYPRLKDNIFISYRLKSKIFKAISQDISGGGLMFEADRKIPLGADLELEIYQPANSFKTLIFVIPVLVKVTWRKKIKYGFLEMGENEYKVGVSFSRMSEDNRKRIIKYVTDNKKQGV